jgi:adenylosuccinate lyase
MIDRYVLPEMKGIWDDKYQFERMLDIEILVCEKLNLDGVIPQKDLLSIKEKASVDLKDIRKKELITKHETVAFVESVSGKIGKSSKYFHYGLTSSDLLDTSLSLILRDSLNIIIKDIEQLRKEIFKKAKKYKKVVVIGRTHGVHAEPTTLGLKFLTWYYQLERDLDRLQNAYEMISYGKISGSVGTYAQINPSVEEYVCKKLKLKPAKISTQILQRDRHAQYLTSLAILGSTMEKIAFEIRNLHRTEVGEMFEPFSVGQKGSSSMPHKKNPILCERICGLSRVLRGNALVGLENISLWHERDMSHSSAERIVLADSSCLVDFMLNDLIYIVNNLEISESNIKKNLEISKGKIFSQSLMLKLVSKGMEKQKAYELVQKVSFEDNNFEKAISTLPVVKKLLSKEELSDIFSYNYYTKYVDTIFRRFE